MSSDTSKLLMGFLSVRASSESRRYPWIRSSKICATKAPHTRCGFTVMERMTMHLAAFGSIPCARSVGLALYV
jgi:hypothetical protein